VSVSRGGRRGSSVTPFCLVLIFITGRRSHSTIHSRGQSLSGCRCSHLEQFTSARHFCTFVACLPVTPQDSSLHHFLSQSLIMYSACALALNVILDTLIVLVTYLLTYIQWNVARLCSLDTKRCEMSTECGRCQVN